MFEDGTIEDWEYPDPDLDEDGEYSETEECPSCGVAIYEDAERCPVCGDYIELSAHSLSNWPTWFTLIGLLGIAAVLLSFFL